MMIGGMSAATAGGSSLAASGSTGTAGGSDGSSTGTGSGGITASASVVAARAPPALPAFTAHWPIGESGFCQT